MKKFKWKLDTSFVVEKSSDFSDRGLFLNYFNAALNTAYKDGLGREYIRRAFNIANKIEACNGSETVDLEDSEFELLKEAFERGKFPSQGGRILVQIYDAIDESEKCKE